MGFSTNETNYHVRSSTALSGGARQAARARAHGLLQEENVASTGPRRAPHVCDSAVASVSVRGMRARHGQSMCNVF